MKKESQKNFVIRELNTSGRISRNYCLSLYFLKVRPSITKLATLISDLRLKDKWDIERRHEKDSNGNDDEVYYLVRSPMKKTEYYVPELDRKITTYV